MLVLYWRDDPGAWGTFDVQSLAIDALPLAFVAMGQAIVIISGGIDLSIGSMMSLVNVLSAKYMVDGDTTSTAADGVVRDGDPGLDAARDRVRPRGRADRR